MFGLFFASNSQIFPRMSTLVSRYRGKELLFPELQAVAASLNDVGILSIIPPSTKVSKEEEKVRNSLILC